MSGRAIGPVVLLLMLVALNAPGFLPSGGAAPLPARPPDRARPADAAPLLFIENVGQFDPAVRFQVRGGGDVWWLMDDAIQIALSRPAAAPVPDGTAAAPQVAALRLGFEGGAARPHIEALTPLEPAISYFFGNDPAQWRPAVPVWGGVRYRALYPGLDLELTGAGGSLAWRWLAAEGTDATTALQAARLTVAGGQVESVAGGLLTIATPLGPVALPLPALVGAGGDPLPLPLPMSASIAAGAAVIAPVGPGVAAPAPLLSPLAESDLLMATYIGGGAADQANAVAVDATGNTYVVGTTFTQVATLPVFAPIELPGYGQAPSNAGDIFVVKFNPAGRIVYWALMGAGQRDRGIGIAVNAAGEAFIVGTSSHSFSTPKYPTTPSNAYSPNGVGSGEVVMTKLHANGNFLLYSTYLGGSSGDEGRGIALDASSNVYVTGGTFSQDFPNTTPWPRGVSKEVFVAKFITTLPPSEPPANSLVYSTFIQSPGEDEGRAIGVDADGAAYITGQTKSTSFPVGIYDEDYTDVYGGSFNVGTPASSDAFLAKIRPNPNLLQPFERPWEYATYIGGPSNDVGRAIAVEAKDVVYIAGQTTSPTLTRATAGRYGGGQDVFAGKFVVNGQGVIVPAYLAYLADAGVATADDVPTAIALVPDGSGKVVVRGETQSGNFPTTATAFRGQRQGTTDPFLVKLAANGSRLLYSTYLGATGNTLPVGWVTESSPNPPVPTLLDILGGVAADAGGSAYVSGATTSTQLPTTVGVQQESFAGGPTDGFLARLTMPETNPFDLFVPAPPTATPTSTPRPPTATPTPTATPGGPGPQPPTPTPGAEPSPSPLPNVTWYFAEGYTNVGFDEYLTIQNPGGAGSATISYFVEGQSAPVTRIVPLAANSRTTVNVHDAQSAANPGGLGRLTVGHATTLVSSVPVVVERPMYFRYSGDIDGGHNVLGATATAAEWYFAEGYTNTGFDEYLTIQNPNAAGSATITYYVEGQSSPEVRTVSLAANSRTTVVVHEPSSAGNPGGLGRRSTGHATKIVSTVAVVVERPMYFIYNGGAGQIDGGHNVLGATAAGPTWYFAEGYTNAGFDEYLTIQNAGSAGTATLTYYVQGQATPIQRTVPLAANSRTTVVVHEPQSAANPGGLGRYAVGHATTVTSTVPVVVERPMYFAYTTSVDGGHNVLGAARSDTEWYFAEGYTGGGFDEYLTINNPGAAGSVFITYFVEGQASPSQRVVALPANSRTTVAVHNAYDPATNPGGLGRLSVGHATRLISTVPVVVERPMYFTYSGATTGVTGGHIALGYAP